MKYGRIHNSQHASVLCLEEVMFPSDLSSQCVFDLKSRRKATDEYLRTVEADGPTKRFNLGRTDRYRPSTGTEHLQLIDLRIWVNFCRERCDSDSSDS